MLNKPKRCARCRNNPENRPCPICYPEKVMKEMEKKGIKLGETVDYQLKVNSLDPEYLTLTDSNGITHRIVIAVETITLGEDGYAYFDGINENGQINHYRVKHAFSKNYKT